VTWPEGGGAGRGGAWLEAELTSICSSISRSISSSSTRSTATLESSSCDCITSEWIPVFISDSVDQSRLLLPPIPLSLLLPPPLLPLLLLPSPPLPTATTFSPPPLSLKRGEATGDHCPCSPSPSSTNGNERRCASSCARLSTVNAPAGQRVSGCSHDHTDRASIGKLLRTSLRRSSSRCASAERSLPDSKTMCRSCSAARVSACAAAACGASPAATCFLRPTSCGEGREVFQLCAGKRIMTKGCIA
jgi:hypothetical protein